MQHQNMHQRKRPKTCGSFGQVDLRWVDGGICHVPPAGQLNLRPCFGRIRSKVRPDATFCLFISWMHELGAPRYT